MRCHPTRWLWGLIPIAMLSWLAVHAESDRIERDLEQRSGAALAAAGHDWASVAFSGREGLLVGRAGSARQRDGAAALVRDVWGVRTVETRVAMSPAAAGLPIASVAAEIAPRSIGDVAPSPIVVAAAADLALARTDIGNAASDQTPAMTVRARDHAELVPPAAKPTQPAAEPAAPIPEQKPAVGVNAPPHAETPLPVNQTAAPIPEQTRAVAVQAAEHAETSPPATEPAAPIPEQKPGVAVNAPPRAETPPPANEAAAPPPVQKPAQAAPTSPQSAPETPVTASAPPLPKRAPRFETAALPQGNIGPEADCVGHVRGAAQRVEVHFAHGRAMLDTAGKALIDGLIGALNICPGTGLHVAGHSDASGQARRNLALSKQRARTVASYMMDKGIDAGRLVAIGYGDTKPVAPNDTQENRAKNRRIEVAITARAAPLPPLPVRKQGTEDGLSRR
jgi:outer membrane protein OmpA-like peptidoglycan-associated protein